MNTEQLLDKLVNAVTFHFRNDETAPGITVARLKSGYYCSIVRYDSAFAKDKRVVCNAKGETLFKTLSLLANTFVSTVEIENPIQDLINLVKPHGKSKYD